MSDPQTTNASGKQGWLGHLAQFAGVMVIIVTAVIWIQDSLHSIDSRLIALEGLMSDRWTRTDMQIWAKDLQLRNDGLTIPGVSHSVLYGGEGIR